MSIAGMYMLNSSEYTEEKIQEALKILYTDRKNEFSELSHVFLEEKKLNEISEVTEMNKDIYNLDFEMNEEIDERIEEEDYSILDDEKLDPSFENEYGEDYENNDGY